MTWSGLDPLLVWGLIPRFVGVLYVLAFGALSFQIVSILGKNGAVPIAKRLQHAKRDFSGVRRFLDFPTVFWLSASDTMIRLVPILGILAGVLAMYGGPIGYAGLVLGWLLWLSVEPAGLIFPWDTMLQEVGFFALFLPLAEALPSLDATALPLPTVAFMFRWLVLRLMLGFAKVKFIGTGKGDGLYLRGFLIWAPMPTPLAWWGHHAPRWFLKGSLYFMFFGEAIAPLLGFFTGPLRLVSFAAMSMLMVGIQLTGNWGYFNIGFVMMSVCLLDTQSSVFDVFQQPWASSALSPADLAIHVTMVLLFLTSLVYFVVLNSWVSRTWVHWHWEAMTWNRPWARAIVGWFRLLAPFHFVNGYGVFPPTSSPPIRFAPVFEGSDDGKTWKGYGFRHLPSREKDPLPLVAPHHPRFDQALHYAGIGIHDGSFYSSFVSDGSPYLAYLRSSWLDRAAQHILRNDEEMRRDIGDNPFPDAPPKWVRVSTFILAPTTPAELRRTGNRWRVRRMGTLIPARTRQDWVEGLAVPEPELFHPDYVRHKKRATPLREMVRAFESGMEPDRAVLVSSDLTSDEVSRFWSEFVPLVREGRGDWTRVHERAQLLMERYTMPEIIRFERLLARFAWLMRARTEPHLERGVEPKIAPRSVFRFEMLLYEVISDGREAYLEIVREPGKMAARAEQSTHASELWTLAMVRYDMTMFHVKNFRWCDIGAYCHRYNIPGIFEYFPLLSELVPPDEEFRPQITKHDDGEYTVEALYPASLLEEPRTVS